VTRRKDPVPTAEQEAAERREAMNLPYRVDLERSELRRARMAMQPMTLGGFVRWGRYAYSMEPPFRLHSHHAGEGGTPQMTGEFMAWLRSAESKGVACAEDEDGFLRTPLRCAVFELHGRVEGTERAGLAHVAYDLASSDSTLPGLSPSLDDIGRRYGLPFWSMNVIGMEALRRLWEKYVPLVRG